MGQNSLDHFTRCWREVLEAPGDDEQGRAALLAKIAAAHHLAGEEAQAQEALTTLTRHYAEVHATLGGRPQSVVAFTRRLLAMPAPRRRPAGPAEEGWPSLAGAPDSLAVMPSCRPVAAKPRWTRSGELVQRIPALTLTEQPQGFDRTKEHGNLLSRQR